MQQNTKVSTFPIKTGQRNSLDPSFLVIGLFRRGRGSRERTLARINPLEHDGGYYKTEVTFPRHPMMGMRSPKATCVYGFYIAYVRGNR